MEKGKEENGHEPLSLLPFCPFPLPHTGASPNPALTSMTWPVMLRAALEHRKRTALLTSEALTMRPSAVGLTYCCRIFAAEVRKARARLTMTLSMAGPSTGPGQIAFTRTLLEPASCARVSVSPINPHLDAQ